MKQEWSEGQIVVIICFLVAVVLVSFILAVAITAVRHHKLNFEAQVKCIEAGGSWITGASDPMCIRLK